MEFYENHLRQQIKLLSHCDYYTQAMCWNVQEKKVVSRELLQGEEAVISWAAEFNGRGNIFLGRNPRDSKGDVQHCTALSLDLDPRREKDTAAGEDAVASTIIAGKKILDTFGCGVLCCSGNGGLLVFPLREPVTSEVAERWGKALEDKARQLIGEVSVNVDSTWDAARLVKAMGCISTKGEESLWRHARIIESKLTDSTAFYQLLEAPQEAIAQHKANSDGWEVEALNTLSEGRTPRFVKLVGKFIYDKWDKEAVLKVLEPHAIKVNYDLDKLKDMVEDIYEKDQKNPATKREMSNVVSGGEVREISLITPKSGLTDYKNREKQGEPELPTGFKSIDDATFGLTRGGIFTVGARTNCGKTTFAISTAFNLCKRGKKVLFLSTETTYHEVWDRYFAVGTGISAFAIQHKQLNGSTPKFNAFLTEFEASHNLIIYDGSRPSIQTVKQAIEQVKPDVLVFDYFQHVEGREVKELEEFVMALKDVAKACNMAILMCAQLHDGAINPKTNKLYAPTLNSMKNCKTINDESRVVLLLDWDRDSVIGSGPAAVKVILAKNKGAKQDCVLKLDRSIPRFEDEV